MGSAVCPTRTHEPSRQSRASRRQRRRCRGRMSCLRPTSSRGARGGKRPLPPRGLGFPTRAQQSNFRTFDFPPAYFPVPYFHTRLLVSTFQLPLSYFHTHYSPPSTFIHSTFAPSNLARRSWDSGGGTRPEEGTRRFLPCVRKLATKECCSRQCPR